MDVKSNNNKVMTFGELLEKMQEEIEFHKKEGYNVEDLMNAKLSFIIQDGNRLSMAASAVDFIGWTTTGKVAIINLVKIL